MKTKIFYRMIIIFTVLLATACRKDKQDVRVGNLPDYSNNAKSTLRVISIDGAVDLMVNNTKLTNFIGASQDGTPPFPYPTPYFPTTGKLKGAYNLPQQFLDKNGEATVKLYSSISAGTFLLDSFKVQENYNQPRDYYTASTTAGVAGVTMVPRSVTAPSDPGHIRIRVVNLSSQTEVSNGKDRLSLAYADGSTVSAITSGVGQGKWSDYAELPYGTYQFKIISADRVFQIPAKPPVLMNGSTPTDPALANSQVYYDPVQTYQPGGVYTIIVASLTGFQYSSASDGGAIIANCFAVVTDVEPPVNVTYGHLQAINAANENGLKLQIDGTQAGSLAYGAAGDYSTLIQGMHAIKITDASGKTVAEKSITIKGGDNLSLWVYPTTNGDAAITTVQNNMTGLRNISANADGSDSAPGVYDPLKFDMELQTRFLNLCPDLPYVTFTGANGQLFAESQYTSSALAAQNLQPGQLLNSSTVPYPYVDMGYVSGGAVNAYSSRPGVVPGNKLTGVNTLAPADFVRMPSQFFYNGRFIAEPGIYTVALIGRNNAGHQPKMIVVKHNR